MGSIWTYVIWYLIIGEISLIFSCALAFRALAKKYGLDLASKAVKEYSNEVYTGSILFEIWLWTVGTLVWPKRLADLPEMYLGLDVACEHVSQKEEREQKERTIRETIEKIEKEFKES